MFLKKLTRQVISNPDYPVVEIASGKVRGVEVKNNFIFRGIPYARAKRFHMPNPVPVWKGIRDACTYGYSPPELVTPLAQDEQLTPHYYARQGEDCQDMNIWTPSIDSASKLPVVVWFHGGGWKSGSSVEQYAYDGENMSRYGNIVFVTFNSRQNCLGNLDLSSLSDMYVDSVQIGLSDVLAALRWIQENIAVFGGDAHNVTLVGQAGGGKRVLAVMQCPAADGLYHKVALGSSGGEHMEIPEGWNRKRIAQRMGELTSCELGLTKTNLKEIETISYYRLSDAVNAAEKKLREEVPDRFRWEPVADDHFLFGDPFTVGFRKETLSIPMMIGSSLGEMMGNSRVKIGDSRKNRWDEKRVLEQIHALYGAQGPIILEEFRKAYPNNPVVNILFLDRVIRPKMNAISLKRACQGGKVWNWLYALESPINDGTIAWHCAEIPFITRNATYLEASYVPGITENLEEAMSEAWVVFARTGNPNHPGIPDWPMVTAQSLPTMIFDQQNCVRIDHDRQLQELWLKK